MEEFEVTIYFCDVRGCCYLRPNATTKYPFLQGTDGDGGGVKGGGREKV